MKSAYWQKHITGRTEEQEGARNENTQSILKNQSCS
jgi:hypothetical protein